MVAEFTTVEGWHTLEDGEKLYTKTWKPASSAKARVILIHGFSDHCNTYTELLDDMASHGYEVFGWDQRGWGRSVKSPKQKGDTGPTSRVLADITSVVRRFLPNEDGLPLYLMGHSMGGAETLHYAALPAAESENAHIAGYLTIAPFCSLSPETKPSSFVVMAGRLAGKLMPRHQLVNKLDAKLISRDPAVQKQFIEDPLCHDTGTLEGLAGLLERAEQLESGKICIADNEKGLGKRHVFVSHGTADGICAYDVSKKWFEQYCNVDDKTFKSYEGYYHRLHSEPTEYRKIFNRDLIGWLDARTT